MRKMTPPELNKLLVDAIMRAHQELTATDQHDDPHVRHAYDLLTSAMDRVISAGHLAFPHQADISAAIASIQDPHRDPTACPCECHSDGQGRRDWPLLTDALGEITACSACREDHERFRRPRDTAA